jgi:hypothetical protein
MADDDSFFSRWSRRKAEVRQAAPVAAEVPVAVPAEPAPTVIEAPVPTVVAEEAERVEPPPTLEDTLALTPASDFTRFVAPDVAPEVKNAALKKLFADPHFNVMDGLDTYIDDYNKPDPLPEGWLRKMVQSQLLGLFADEEKPPAALAPQPEPAPVPAAHEDTDLQLQPVDDAGRTGPEPGAGEDAASQP